MLADSAVEEDEALEETKKRDSAKMVEMIPMTRRQTSTMLIRRQTSTFVEDDSDGDDESVEL